MKDPVLQAPSRRLQPSNLLPCLLFLAIAGCLVVWYPIDAAVHQFEEDPPQYASRTVYILLFLYAILRVNVVAGWIGTLRPLAPMLLFGALLSMVIAHWLSSGSAGLAQTLVNVCRYGGFVLVLPVLAYEARPYLRHRYVSVLIFIAAVILFAILLDTSAMKMERPTAVLRYEFGDLPQTTTADHLMAVVVLAALAWTGLGKPTPPQRLLYLTAGLLMAVSILLTGSRAPLGVLVLGACGVLALRRPDMLNRGAAALLVAFAFAVAVFLLRAPLLDLFPAERLEAFSRPSFTSGRVEMWKQYIDYFQEHPRAAWIGLPYNPDPWWVVPSYKPPHNWFLGILCEHGAVTLVFLFGFNLYVILAAWRLMWRTRSDFWLTAFIAMAMVMTAGSIGNTAFLNIGLHIWLYYALAGAVLYRLVGIERAALDTTFDPFAPPAPKIES